MVFRLKCLKEYVILYVVLRVYKEWTSVLYRCFCYIKIYIWKRYSYEKNKELFDISY